MLLLLCRFSLKLNSCHSSKTFFLLIFFFGWLHCHCYLFVLFCSSLSLFLSLSPSPSLSLSLSHSISISLRSCGSQGCCNNDFVCLMPFNCCKFSFKATCEILAHNLVTKNRKKNENLKLGIALTPTHHYLNNHSLKFFFPLHLFLIRERESVCDFVGLTQFANKLVIRNYR